MTSSARKPERSRTTAQDQHAVAPMSSANATARARQQARQHGRAVERRQRDEVEEHQHDVERTGSSGSAPPHRRGQYAGLAEHDEHDRHRHARARRFMNGPASDDQHVARAPRQPLGVVRRVGLHRLAPGDEREPRTAAPRPAATTIVPIRSMWASGDSVSRPCRRGSRSPSRSATKAWPNSCTETETTNAIRVNSATRTWSAEMSTPRRLPD